VQRGKQFNADRIRDIMSSTVDAFSDASSSLAFDVAQSSNPAAKVPPFAMAFPLDPGERVGTSPTPVAHPRIIEAIVLRSKEIWSAYSVPAQMSFIEKNDFAANNELALSEFNQRVEAFQRTLEPLFADMYEFVQSYAMDSVEATFVESMQRTLETAAEQVVEHSKRRAETNTKRSAAAATFEDAVAQTGGQFDEGMAHAARLLFRSKHRVGATLHYTPITTYASLQLGYMDGVLDLEALRRHAGPLLGIPEADISKEDLPHNRHWMRNPSTAGVDPKALLKQKTAKPK
jgi:hypothetical protein